MSRLIYDHRIGQMQSIREDISLTVPKCGGKEGGRERLGRKQYSVGEFSAFRQKMETACH